MPPDDQTVSAFRFIPRCCPMRDDTVPAGNVWLHDVKFDGYGVQAHKAGSRVIIYSLNGHDFTERFPSIAQLLHELPAKAAVLDGEVVSNADVEWRRGRVFLIDQSLNGTFLQMGGSQRFFC